MALFQKSVIKKYLNDLDKEKLREAWLFFKNHFHNPHIQANIRDAKEEEYQEGFVRDLFVEILGYTLKPQPDYNFVLEKKTEADATKSDGALLRGQSLIGVVELKDTATIELDKIEKQVFGYKHKHKNCIYVITSNFEKLRFYINDAIDFEEFDLFALTEDRFAILYLCLQQQYIQNDIPLKMKQASVSEEESVTKKLYTDYSVFKRKLFANIAELNPQYGKLELFKKTQKLLDRFLFILFAEDRLLLPPNSVRVILQQWEQLKELDNYVPLYDRYKLYFSYLNTGHQGKQHEIFAYNGGLFATDEILDSIKIDDTILHNGTKALSSYDFESEVDVNILGHIFEHSLSEIEEVQAELEGTAIEKTKTRRKKDGVFYTPRYITKYIVENTVGTLCEQKKEELSINEEVFAYRKTKKTREPLLKKLEAYRNWLLQLTICDPACGSGAFLNQALEFLITEHRYIDELKAKLFGDAFVLTDIENEILENNLFGVDINDEAVEIARLSLWLRTAKKGRKLSNLSNNIKVGNSLIDDPAVAGDKAFNWQKEFPQVFGLYKETMLGKQQVKSASQKNTEEIKYESFENADKDKEKTKTHAESNERIINIDLRITNDDHRIVNEPEVPYGIKKEMNRGFDVVIGNPPYGAKLTDNVKKWFKQNFKISSEGKIDTYKIFFEKSFQLLKDKGYFAFITPNTFLYNTQSKKLRNLIIKNFTIKDAVELRKNIFEDAPDVVTTILALYKVSNNRYKFRSRVAFPNYTYKDIDNDIWEIDQTIPISVVLEDNDYKINLRSNFNFYSIKLKIEKNKRLGKFFVLKQGTKPHGDKENKEEGLLSKVKYDENWEPAINGRNISQYYIEFENDYVLRSDKLHSCLPVSVINNPKIYFQRMRKISLFPRIVACYDDNRIHGLYTCSVIYSELENNLSLKYILTLLNSLLINLWYKYFDTDVEIKLVSVKEIPIPEISKEAQLTFIEKADIMLAKNKEHRQLKQQLQQLMLSKYEGLKFSKKLEDWPTLSFKEFLKELSKQKVKLSLAEENEWMNYFEEQKNKANAIQQVITQTDKEIDQMVYALYGLTEEEIKIVESN